MPAIRISTSSRVVTAARPLAGSRAAMVSRAAALNIIPYTVGGLQYWMDPTRYNETGRIWTMTGSASGTQMSAAVATGTGTPTALTFSGTVKVPMNLKVTCTLGGARGVFTFNVSLDGGATTYKTGVLSAATNSLGNGVTLNWANTASTLGDIWTATSMYSGGTSLDSSSNVVDTTKSWTNTINNSNLPQVMASATFNNQLVIKRSPTNNSMRLISGTFTTPIAQPYTVYTAVDLGTASIACIFADIVGGSTTALFRTLSSKSVSLNAGSSSWNSASNVWVSGAKIICAVVNGANSAVYLDDSTTPIVQHSVGTSSLTGVTVANQSTGGAGCAEMGHFLIFSGAHGQAMRYAIGRGMFAVPYGLTWT